MAIVVGDIHGNFAKAKAFLAYKPEALHVALGDYLDSFTVPVQQQVECLNLLMDSAAILLLGNHDLHYLRKPLFHFAGYQINNASELQDLIEYNLFRYKAAYAIDGYLLTHAGVHKGFTVSCDDVELIADRLQMEFGQYLQNRLVTRNVNYKYNSIFQYNFKIWVEGNLLPTNIKQIFGHVENARPLVEPHYIALDTTNNKSECWLYDTAMHELVRLPLAGS